jgi:hypothetical protein
MPEQPVDMTHELLRQIRAEQVAFRTEVERRFDALESDVLEVKRSLRGLTYFASTIAGRREEIETRVDRLVPRG